MTGSAEDERTLPPVEVSCARREAILDAATSLFAEHGYGDADTQALADRLGVGKGTIYRHFASKRELFLAAADRVMRRLRERLEPSLLVVADPLDRISQGIRISLEFFAEHPEFVELIIQERALFKDRKKPTFLEHREINLARWSEIYRTLIADGRLREMPAERVSDVVGRLIYGTMFTNYLTGAKAPPECQAREIADVVFFGILSECERRRQRGGGDAAGRGPDG